MKKILFVFCLIFILFTLVSCDELNALPTMEAPLITYKFKSGEAKYDLKNNQIVFIDGASIYIYQAKDMKLINSKEIELSDEKDWIKEFDVNDGKLVITFFNEKNIKIFNLKNLNLLKTIKFHEDSTISNLKLAGNKLFFNYNNNIHYLKWNSLFTNILLVTDFIGEFILGPNNTIFGTNGNSVTVYDYKTKEIVYSDKILDPEVYYGEDAFFDGKYYHYRGTLYNLEKLDIFSTNSLVLNYPEMPGYIPLETLYYSDDISIVKFRDENVSYQHMNAIYDIQQKKYIHLFDFTINSYSPIIRINKDFFYIYDYGTNTVGFLDISKIES